MIIDQVLMKHLVDEGCKMEKENIENHTRWSSELGKFHKIIIKSTDEDRTVYKLKSIRIYSTTTMNEKYKKN